MVEIYIHSFQKLENDMITIEIVSISFFEGSSILQDDEIQMLYVEFSFLGYYGEDMETVSIKKPIMPNQEIIYNFSRSKFSRYIYCRY